MFGSLSLCALVAWALTAGPSLPGTAASAGSGVAWTNFNNIKADDGSVAQSVPTSTNTFTAFLRGTNFGFAIPDGATINGVTVVIEKRVGLITAGATLTDASVNLIGSTPSTNKAAAGAWPSTLTDVTYGSSSDLWNVAWTSALINDAGFGVDLSVDFNINEAEPPASGRAQVDKYTVAVDYTEAGGTRRRVRSTVE